MDSSTHAARSKGARSSSSRPDSIFEKSRMSLMMVNRCSPLLRIVSAISRCWRSSRVSVRRPDMPMMAFIGVRIS